MSLRTKIRGFTAWVNLRLIPYDQLLNNVLMDLLTGTNIKMLLESLTGKTVKRLDSFDGLTQQQKITRVEWLLEELKNSKLIPNDIYVDTRMFAMRSADHIFEVLWRLVCHDILFVWERAEYLQQDSDEVLCEVPFKWVPEPPPPKKKKKQKKSLLSGFGASSIVIEKSKDDDVEQNYDRFPRSEFMKKFKPPSKQLEPGKSAPPVKECIMDMVKQQLKTVHEGKKLNCTSIDDLADSRVVCALVNSFVPNTFTTEVLLNDRWTINKVLETTENMFYMKSPFDSEDLVAADNMSVCAYFCVFFMVAYKYRQSRAVVNFMDNLKRAKKECENELEYLPTVAETSDDIRRKQQLENDICHIEKAMQRLGVKFDLDFCQKWMEHIKEIVKEVHKDILLKIKVRFDTVTIPRDITIANLCLSMGINLSLTNGSGFCMLEGRETLSEGRKVVIKEKGKDEYTDDFTSKGKANVNRMFKVNKNYPVEVDLDKFPNYEVFFEMTSKNRHLKSGSTFLYQVFPSNMMTWQKMLFKAVKNGEVETVERMATFFRTIPSFITSKEPHTGNSTLHCAARLGLYDMVLCLLENGANIDQKNTCKQTALFSACEGQHQSIAHLLVEWGCDVHTKGSRSVTAFEVIKIDELRDFLIDAYDHYSTFVPKVMEGDTELLLQLVQDHQIGIRKFNNLRSRCINGSTLLHTGAYFGSVPVIQQLFMMGVDVNLRDYKGASALHRARDVHVLKVLMDVGASPNIEDSEGNTPLHVKCYGETGKPSELEAIDMLIKSGGKILVRNQRGLLPVHCCAMQGRIDVIELLLKADREGMIKEALNQEQDKMPPSVVHLAVANDFIACAEWLLENGFNFKPDEENLLVQRILTEQINLENRADALQFLLECGANLTPDYSGGNTAIHFAVCMSGNTDVLKVLINAGCDVDATNEDGATALFFACQCNNQMAASILIANAANFRIKNLQGLSAFDYIMDYDEWISFEYLSEEIKARLKAFSLKHCRDLIRAISKKVKSHSQSRIGTSATMTMISNVSRERTTFSLPPISDNNQTQITVPVLPLLERRQGHITY